MMMNNIYFAKTNPKAHIPTKRAEDAGYDIYACFEEDYIEIKPHETKMIPTGIASACSPDYCFILKERGSTGSKGMAQRCGIIDSGYRGEWFCPITNTTDMTIRICKESVIDKCAKVAGVRTYPYEKAICQALVVPVPSLEVKELSYDEIVKINSERGIGALGSSNK